MTEEKDYIWEVSWYSYSDRLFKENPYLMECKYFKSLKRAGDFYYEMENKCMTESLYYRNPAIKKIYLED